MPAVCAPTSPRDPVTKGNVLDALPFVNSLVTLEMTGTQIREVIEQGPTLERGLVQASGLRATYDLSRPAGKRLLDLRIGARPVADAKTYRVATNSFLAQGGDLYQTFLRAKTVEDGGRLLSEVVMDYFRERGHVGPPAAGRMVPDTQTR